MRALLALLLLLPGLAFGAVGGPTAGSSCSADNSACTPTVPAHSAGDYLQVACGFESSAGTISTPSGWTLHASITSASRKIYVFGKVAASGSESASCTPSGGSAGEYVLGASLKWTGTHQTIGSVIYDGTTSSNSTSDSTIEGNGSTGTTDGAAVIWWFHRGEMTGQTALTGFSASTPVTNNASLGYQYRLGASGGDSTAITVSGGVGGTSSRIDETLAPGVTAPTWSVSPTVSAQDDNDYTLSYTPSTSATFYAVACAKDETAPTIAQVKAAHCTGDAAAIASANEAVTGADTTVLGGSLTRPVHDLYAVLSNAGGDSTLATLADECLDAASWKTIVNCPTGLTSIHANSPINDFNSSVTPDIVAGDIMVADSATDLGDALTWTATGLYSYDGNSARRKFSANFYDLSAGANHADTMQVCVNNVVPVASVAYYDAVLVKDHPFTAIDFCTMFSDADDPTLTCTSDEAGTGTGAGTRPAGTTMTAGVFDDTGSGATSADGSTGSLNITATDSCGDTATIPFGWSVYSQVTVPDCVAGSLSSCMDALSAVNLDTSFESQCSATVAALNVISQTPAASTVVDPFTGVSLVVSSGKCSRPARGIQIGIGIGVN